jgi:predicted DCC family thiol-disulfide oxidoreductase YuxK
MSVVNHSFPESPAGGAFPVLMFDGDCGLCQRLVRGLMRLDRAGRLRFAPLQGRTAQAYLRRHGLPTVDFDTRVFVPDWSRRERREFLVRTAGVIGALRSLHRSGARVLAGLLAAFPPRLRDAGYRWVARGRFRIFGPWQPRAWPRPEWAERVWE